MSQRSHAYTVLLPLARQFFPTVSDAYAVLRLVSMLRNNAGAEMSEALTWWWSALSTEEQLELQREAQERSIKRSPRKVRP